MLGTTAVLRNDCGAVREILWRGDLIMGKQTEKQIKEWFEKRGREEGDLPVAVGRRPTQGKSQMSANAEITEKPKKKKKT
jgi:hypothetical protein